MLLLQPAPELHSLTKGLPAMAEQVLATGNACEAAKWCMQRLVTLKSALVAAAGSEQVSQCIHQHAACRGACLLKAVVPYLGGTLQVDHSLLQAIVPQSGGSGCVQRRLLAHICA